MANDEELAAELPPAKTSAPSITEFSPVVNLLTILADRMGDLTAVVASGNSRRRVRPPKPLPRPITAADRLKSRKRRATYDYIVSLVQPREGKPTMADGPAPGALHSAQTKRR